MTTCNPRRAAAPLATLLLLVALLAHHAPLADASCKDLFAVQSFSVSFRRRHPRPAAVRSVVLTPLLRINADTEMDDFGSCAAFCVQSVAFRLIGNWKGMGAYIPLGDMHDAQMACEDICTKKTPAGEHAVTFDVQFV